MSDDLHETDDGTDDAPDVIAFRLTHKQYSAYRVKLHARDPHCLYCGRTMKLKSATLDHLQPQSRGGIDSPGNLFLACATCNTAKGDRTLKEWLTDLQTAAERIGAAA